MDLRESGDGKALAKGVKSNTSVTRFIMQWEERK
jgi:hypothetical protein